MSMIRIWGKGQLTIPVALRRELGLKEESLVSVVKVGTSLMIVPKAMEGDRLAARLDKKMRAKNITLQDLLKDLKKARKDYARERFGG